VVKDSGLRKIQNEGARPTQAMAAEKHAGYNKKEDEGAKASEKRPKDDNDHSAVVGSGSDEDDGSGDNHVETDVKNDHEDEDSDDQEDSLTQAAKRVRERCDGVSFKVAIRDSKVHTPS
jgi:hypothetical protein